MNIIQITRKQETLSEISCDIAQIFFASMFIGPLIDNDTNWIVVSFGLIFSIIAWLLGLLLAKK